MNTETLPKTEIGILEKDREAVSKILNMLLADEYVLYTKCRNFHWNVTGMHFADLHALFEKQYEELNEFIDNIAERIRSLGNAPLGSLGEFLDCTRLREDPGKLLHGETMLAALLEDHEAVIRILRQDIKVCTTKYHDEGTTDFLTGLLERHEKTAWMLRAHLDGRH